MIDALATKLSEPRFAGLSDADAADAVNALRVSVRRPVETWKIRRAAIEAGYWPGIVLAAQDASSRQRQEVAIAALAWVDDQSGVIQTVDMDRPGTALMLSAAVDVSLLTQQQADSLMALADADIPWTDHVGLPEVGIGLVINARRLIDG